MQVVFKTVMIAVPKRYHPKLMTEASPNTRKRATKQRHINSLQKSSHGNLVSSGASEAPKDHPHVATTEITLKECSSSESNVPNTSITAVEPSTQQRRIINRTHKTAQTG